MKNKLIFVLAISLLSTLFLSFNKAQSEDIPVLMVFYSPGCHRCINVKKNVLPQIEEKYKGRIDLRYYDTTDIKNYTFLLSLKEKYNKNVELDLPVFFMGNDMINGLGNVKAGLEFLIDSSLGAYGEQQAAPEVDLLTRFKSFKPLAVIGAGLTDGINPCAFTVIVFFISYLALQGYKKLELIIIGLSFIFAVFITYLLLGLGIFNFLYRLEAFWIVAKAFNIGIGVFSLCLGALAIYDLLKFRKDKDTQGQLLQLPQAVKNQIHAVIGMHYRKGKASAEEKGVVSRLFKLVLSALITGFLVSILEAVCTGQLYLPTISFILKTTPLKLQALGYLIAYNIMFVVPLFIIFLLALSGVTSAAFAQFIRKHMVLIKALMAVVFISLGVFLVWRG